MRNFLKGMSSILLLLILSLTSCENSMLLDSDSSPEPSMVSRGITSGRGAGIVQNTGRLQVYGNKVKSEDGRQISLAGMSFFWSNWAKSYYTASTVDYLVDNFEVSLVRAAYGVPESSGPDYDYSAIEAVVDQAIARDIYVLIDWHTEGDAYHHHQAAKDFFAHMAQKYGDYPHVIYELWNEPTHSATYQINNWGQEMTNIIRQYDPDNLVILGSHTWSQYPNEAYIDDSNAAYTFHGYFDDPANGAAHREQFYKNVDGAMNMGKAVFVTEFGAHYGTNWGTSEIMDACIERGISMAAWSVNDKPEPWSIFESFMGNLTEIGQFYKSRMTSWPPVGGIVVKDPIAAVINGDTRIEAEMLQDLSWKHGDIQIESKSAASGGKNVGYIDNGDYIDFYLDVQTPGIYDLVFGVAAKENTSSFTFGTLGTVDTPITSGWGDLPSEWTTVTLKNVTLSGGLQTIKLESLGQGWNLDYVDFRPSSPSDMPVAIAGADITITNPDNSVTLDGENSYDPDGSIISYNWSGEGLSSSEPSVTITGLVVDAITTLTYTLTVTDNDGNTSSDTIMVTVKPEQQTTNIVAIKSGINGKYLSAEDAGAAPLVANRDSIGDWEKFELVPQADGSYGLKALANGLYLATELYQGEIIKARSTTVDTWEKFYIEDLGNGGFAIKSAANGKYLVNEMYEENVIKARSTNVDTWETFYLEYQ